MSAITTHILDLSTGRPAAGVEVVLEWRRAGEPANADSWTAIGRGSTDADGRQRTLLAGGTAPETGWYRLTFATGAYFARVGTATFYPFVTVVFEVTSGDQHYHVPLLLSPFGYSTYRGS
jgi:5-hydroxyisourate hydrolase